jgi:hypothetical protein
MTEQEPPVREEQRYKYTDETQKSVDKKFTPMRLVVWVIAVLFIVFGMIWLGYALGLLAAIIPGGPGIFEGWVWGIIGLIGVAVAAFLVYSAQKA